MKKKAKLISISASILVVITLSLTVFNNSKFASKTNIDNILEGDNYSYLPVEAKEYLRGVYEETGEIILTEKNKEENKAYLNPDYVLYLENGKASEYGYIPEEFIVDHSYKNDTIIEKHGTSETNEIESLSYYNLRNNGYITNIYDQGSEGLCWTFSSSTSLESHLAIKSNKETMLTFSEKQIDYATTKAENAIDAGENPYISSSTPVLGTYLNEGGNMLRFVNSTAIGISPVLCKGNCSNGANYNNDNSINDNKYWKYDYSFNSKLSPYEVLNIENTQYSLNETLFFNPLSNNDQDEVDALVKILKNQIVNNGSLYVSVGAYTNLSVEYTPTDGETALNSNGKNLIYYIPSGWNVSLNHAVSIIGWDDNYTHNICLNQTAFKITDAPKYSTGYNCSNGTLHTIKGAWIAQNSWGEDTDTFIYLPYNSMKSSYSSISEVDEVDFDNSYRATGWRTTISKGNTKEILNKVKFFVSLYNQTIKIYYDEDENEIIINDGSKSSYGTLLATVKTTHPGLYTVDLLDKNIIFNEDVNKLIFTFDTDDTDYKYFASIHTNNALENDKFIDLSEIAKTDESILAKCNLSDNKCISEPQLISFDDNNVFVISGTTRNLLSSDNLTFKVLNESKEDITNLFHVFRNFSVSNYINALISYNDNNVTLGTYTIEVYYNGVKYDELEWKLEKHNNIIDGIGTEQNPHRIKTVEDLNDIRNHITSYSITTGSITYNYRRIFGYYVLENDLDLTYDTRDKNGLFYNDGNGWDPIYAFAGNFDGNNHTITGLYISRSSSESAVGLFGGVIGNNNYIRNIILKDVNITGNSDVGALIGGIYESRGIDIHDIAIINGKIVSSSHVIGSIIGQMAVQEDSEYNFYNLFNNATVGQSNANFTGGFIGYIEGISPYDQVYNVTISDSVNLGNVYGGAGKTAGIIAEVSGATELTFKNIISVGTYKNYDSGKLGDVFGTLYENVSLNMNNIYYLNNLYGSSLVLNGENDINNNTKIVFKDIITNNAINNFEHKDEWIYPEVDGIKRIPMLKSMVNYFDFTEKIEDFDLGITNTINIYDLIVPATAAAKNIEYTYDDDYLSIDSKGVITPKKLGTTTIHINSLYDGYEDDIQVTIKETNTITYNSNNDADESNTQQVYSGESASLNKNTFKYTGHLFKNWNTEPDGTGITYTDEQLIEEGISTDLQLYAQWEPNKQIVTFDSNDGTGTMENQTFYYNVSQEIIENIFKKDNYVFKEWNTQPDGTGTSYTNKQSIKVTSDLTLYAQWTPEEYVVTFESNGGTGTMENQTFYYDISNNLFDVKFTKDGYTFKDWNTASDGTGTSYTNEQSIKITEDITLYAQWEENGITLNKDKVFISPNDIEKLTVKLVPEDSTVTYTWTSSDENIVSVDSEGNITAKGIGKATITVTSSNGFTASCEVTVSEFLKGDMNKDGSITITDVIKLLRVYLTLEPEESDTLAIGDMNEDGSITITDVIKLLRIYLGLE